MYLMCPQDTSPARLLICALQYSTVHFHLISRPQLTFGICQISYLKISCDCVRMSLNVSDGGKHVRISVKVSKVVWDSSMGCLLDLCVF